MPRREPAIPAASARLRRLQARLGDVSAVLRAAGGE